MILILVILIIDQVRMWFLQIINIIIIKYNCVTENRRMKCRNEHTNVLQKS